jgi:hypothetical protein
MVWVIVTDQNSIDVTGIRVCASQIHNATGTHIDDDRGTTG